MYKQLPILLLVVTFLAGCASPTSLPVNTSLPAITENTTTQIPASPTRQAPTNTPTPTPTQIVIEGLGRETASLLIGGEVNYPPVVGDGSLWIPMTDRAKVLRVDLETGELLAEIPAGRSARPCCSANSVAFGGGFVWVAQSRDNAILIIDPAVNEVVDRIPVGVDVYDLVVDGNTLWATSFGADSVLRIDIESRQVVTTIGDVLKPTGIVVGGGAVWVVEHRKGNVVRINPATNTIEAKILLESVEGHYPSGNNVVFAFGSVWAPNNEGETVVRIDPATNEQIAISFQGFGPLRVTAGNAGIWVTYWDKARDPNPPQTIAWIDTETNTVTYWNFTDAWQLLEHEGVMWAIAGSRKGGLVYRIKLEQ